MESNLKVLFIDAATSFYRITHYKVGNFFGPVDLGLHLSGKHNSLNICTGLLAEISSLRCRPCCQDTGICTIAFAIAI